MSSEEIRLAEIRAKQTRGELLTDEELDLLLAGVEEGPPLSEEALQRIHRNVLTRIEAQERGQVWIRKVKDKLARGEMVTSLELDLFLFATEPGPHSEEDMRELWDDFLSLVETEDIDDA